MTLVYTKVVAIKATTIMIPKTAKANFQINFIQSLYGTSKYDNPASKNTLVGAINITKPYIVWNIKATTEIAPASNSLKNPANALIGCGKTL